MALPLAGKFDQQSRTIDTGRLAFAGLLLLALGMPFERIEPLLRGPGFVVTSLEALMGLALGVWGLHLIASRHRPRWQTELSLPLGLLLITAFLAALVAPTHQAATVKGFGRLVIGVTIFMMVVDLTSMPGRAVAMVRTLVITGWIVAGVGLLEMLRLPGVLPLVGQFREAPATFGGALRLSSVLPSPNPAALVLAMTGCLGLGVNLAAYRRHALRAAGVWSLAIGMIAAALALTLSRGGLVAFAVGILSLAIAGRRIPSWRWLIVVGVAGAALLAGAARAREVLWVRLVALGNGTGFDAAYVGPEALTLPPGGQLTVPLTVLNTGRRTWAAHGQDAIRLGIHWLHDDGTDLEWEGARTPLPQPVAPGEQAMVPVVVRAPSAPGRYILAWDLVEADYRWFAYWWIQTGQTRISIVPDARPAIGPTARLQQFQSLPVNRMPRRSPRRRDLWATALRISLERPWLGVGPDNFRLVYGRYLGLPDPDVRFHAHNIYLEFLADLGWPGLFLWTWITLISLRVAWRLLRPVPGQRRGEAAWGAGIGAALIVWWVHSLVDVFIWATPTYVLFWMTLGLTVAVDRAGRESEREFLMLMTSPGG